ncbi:hypothetical protein SRB5_56110 [Streptomyces sp. RB5]|uniref:Condensation domain-containing protein n=1 Tax=Streptomyces smaragdinus TaxID=2585196 RepID=A0A7K0CPQ7_9ACTN|nr:condensation domain-containing protein [Streptomyces smaragdinus]MQY15429.1 hypothetical protein [Streptomyces smaragdinus]
MTAPLTAPRTAPAGEPLPVPFTGGRAGEAPLTWGQRAIWHAIRRTAPNDHYFNLGRVLPLADRGTPVDVPRLTTALTALMERHESLRTRVVTDYEGDTRQQLHATGTIDLTVHDDAHPDALLTELVGRRFDYAEEWPVRFAAVRSGGRITHVVLALCHLASDGHGAEVLVRDLRLLVRRGSAGPACPDTPYDLAHRQHSPAGRRTSAASLALWERGLREVPPTMFARPVAEPSTPRWWQGRLVSAALPRAVDALAARHRVSGSTVLLTAAAALVAASQGHPAAAVMPIAGNRAGADRHNLVSTLSQDALFVLRMPDDPATTFTGLLADAWPAALAGYRAASYDPADCDALRERVSRERGTEIHPYCCFNDMRLVDRPPTARPAPDAAEPAELRSRTTLDFASKEELVACRYCVHVSGDSTALTVTLMADTVYLPPPAIHAQLRAIEEVVVSSAFGTPPTLAQLPDLLEDRP